MARRVVETIQNGDEAVPEVLRLAPTFAVSDRFAEGSEGSTDP
jgi:hypothetical protein